MNRVLINITAFSGLSRKLKYVYRLIVTTPNFGWIIILQVLSGFFTVAGIPMLIPVLEYTRTDALINSSNISHMHLFNKIFDILGLEPSFNSFLFMASLLIISGQLLVFVSNIIANFSQQDISMQYRKKAFNSYSKVDWLWLTRDKSGEMNYAVLREADGAGVAHLNSQRIVIYLVQVIAFLFIVVNLSLAATILAFTLYGFLFFINSINAKYVRRLSEKFNEAFKRVSNATVNLQQNKKFFKSSLLHKAFLIKIFNYVDDTVRIKKSVILREELQILWTFLATFVFIVLLMVFRKMLHLGFSELLVVLLVFMRLGPHFAALFTAYLTLNTQIPIHQSIEKRIKDLEDNVEKSGNRAFSYDNTIRFKNVSFKYPRGERVINDISLDIKPFHSAAFVGSSGAGKSTILDLVLGLFKPDSGSIYFGDIPHDQLDTKNFRKNIAYVSQETTLLDGTLLENLIIGNPDASDDEIKDVCKQVNLDSLIHTLPDGINTEIGENGIKLSGGQKQRVALGRALLMKPMVLILDEATSELDTETEMFIQNSIRDLRKNMTVIMVAHRLSTIKFADVIYVIEEGTVCEAGTYKELMDKRGRFCYLDSLQNKESIS